MSDTFLIYHALTNFNVYYHHLFHTEDMGLNPDFHNLLFQVVSLLLDHVDAKSAYEALLLAIKLGHDEIAEMILEHPKYDEITTELR